MGVDDDCNGLVDCADPGCVVGFECVETAPDGWSGPGILFVSANDAGASSIVTCPESPT